jgi:hypothetical protein
MVNSCFLRAKISFLMMAAGQKPGFRQRVGTYEELLRSLGDPTDGTGSAAV